jgi:DNA-binding response OmpR family regulator
LEWAQRPRRALIVDDEPKIVEILTQYLKDEGFEVTPAFDGAEAIEKALAEPFDVVLLDLNLPVVSGVEVFKRIRRQSDVPVLMITVRDEVVDRLVGLELGADDYIAKPFNAREVVARVKNIVARSERAAAPAQRVEHDIRRFGELEIDRTAHEVRLGEMPLRLTPTEYRVLDALVLNPGAAMTRAQILDAVSADGIDVYDRTLDKHIANLRQKMGDDASRPRYIVTLPGVGYKLSR